MQQEDDSLGQVNFQDREGTTIITVAPREAESLASNKPKKGKRRHESRRQKLPKVMKEYNEQPESYVPQDRDKEGQKNSQTKIRGIDQQTAGDLQQGGLAVPYQFLTQRSPSLFRIFFPRFAILSITFFLSLVYIIMFILLIAYNYSKEQTQITWNCSLYQLQNKYFPRLNHNHQIWRVIVSAFFHSNIAHFFLNLFALQIYGYFVEWYYGPKAYIATIIIAIIFSHFFAAVIQMTSISTTSSAVTMAIIALKIYFLYEYRHYRKLAQRRNFLYILLALIVGINLIPIFVVNNVDFSAHLGGFLVGGLLGMYFHKNKLEEPTKCDLFLKWGSPILLIIGFGIVVALTFAENSSDFEFLATNIETMCSNNHV